MIAIIDDIILFVFLLLKLNIYYTSFLKGNVMRIFLLPIIITTLVWVLNHNIKRNKVNNKETVRDYLKREEEANFVRKKDISNLPYIKVPLDKLPIDITLNDEKKQSKIEKYRKEIEYLSDKTMLNLIGITNTELKEQYGVANLDKLMTYDQNYARMLSNLQWYAAEIYDEYPAEAVRIMEYMVDTGTDIIGTFELLGRYYAGINDMEAFNSLFDRIPDKSSVSGKTIISKLEHIIEDKPDFSK